jgi:hypothetical protein
LSRSINPSRAETAAHHAAFDASFSLAPREGWRYHYVQAIIVSIDQYAEAALGNREFFLNKPYGIGGGMKDDIP